MEKITERKAIQLIEEYENSPRYQFVIYNIRRRDYILHDYYRYFYRFSRRESVWNNAVVNIEDVINKNMSKEEKVEALVKHINTERDKIVSGKLKRNFTINECYDLLHYYFNAKTYLAYYDHYLGRVVLIKERDKSTDFIELVGSRYHFIGDLHRIIKHELGIPASTLTEILQDVMNTYKPIVQIEHIDELANALHPYILASIENIESYISKLQEAAESNK